MKKIAIVVGVLLVLGFVAIAVVRVKSSIERNSTAANPGSDKPPSVSVVAAERKTLPLVVSITGTVRAQNEAVVFTKMAGRITHINVEVGQMVKAGDTLAYLEANDLGWRVKQQEAQLKVAQAGLENAKVNQKTATSAWDRAQGLHSKKAMSEAEFEQSEAQFHLSAVGVQAAEAQVALADAALGSANQALSDSRLTTPIAGVVSKKNVDVGSQANPGQPAFVVQDQSMLKVQGSVPASDVVRLKKGMPVRITVDEMPGKSVDGQLASISPSLDGETRRALVEVTLKPVEGLLPYMFGHADIDFGTQDGVLVVPASAVVATAEGSVVYAVREGKAVLLKPKLGGRVDDDIVVEDGVKPGDKVIVSGDSGLRDGVRVAVAGET
ncbi:MAG TPA: efflux RND transporter periplasmic adaptor subunit [Myxococcota bacterium]